MLTETKFKQLYEEASRFRDTGNPGTAREILLFLFDAGRSAGGYGVARLSFVLGDLAEIAQVGKPRRGEEAEKTLAALVERRDARERLARGGEAGFTELQELVALNQSLAEPERSRALYRELAAAAPESEELEAARHTLGSLLVDAALPDDVEAILRWIDFAALKRLVVTFTRRVAERKDDLAAAPPAETEVRDRAVASLREVADLIKVLLDRYRGQQAESGPRDPKWQLVALARQVKELLDRYGLLSQAEGGKVPPDSGRLVPWLQKLASELDGLVADHRIEPGVQEEEALRRQVKERARDVALLICEVRVHEDFGPPLDKAMSSFLEARIRREGLLVYEVLLRQGEEALAETLASWMLAFRLTKEMYADLLEGARRAGNPRMQDKLRDEARRLVG